MLFCSCFFSALREWFVKFSKSVEHRADHIVEILVHLESHDILELLTPGSSLPISVTKDAMLAGLGGLGLSPMILNKKIVFRSLPQTFVVVLRLVDAFVPSKSISDQITAKDILFQQDLTWIVNIYQRLWKIVVQWAQIPALDDVEAKSRVFEHFTASLRILRRSNFYLSGLQLSHPEVTRILVQICGDLVTLDQLDRMPGVQEELKQLLDDLSHASRHMSMLLSHMRNTTSASVIGITKSEGFQSLDSGLQVGMLETLPQQMLLRFNRTRY